MISEEAKNIIETQFSLSSVSSSVETLFSPSIYMIVARKIYRSSMFDPKSYPFILKVFDISFLTICKLNLKSIIFLSPEYPPDNLSKFVKQNKIEFHNLGLQHWLDNNTKRSSLMKEALEYILNVKNAPGRFESGVLVGCLRRLMNWNLASILAEYRRFAGCKFRLSDEQFIELFDTDIVSIIDPLPWFYEAEGRFSLTFLPHIASRRSETSLEYYSPYK